MTYPDHDDFLGGEPWTPDELDELLDQLLGEDVDPNLSMEAKLAIVRRVRAEENAALDRLLDLDGVAVPGGLAERVLGALDPQLAGDRDNVFVPAAPRRRRLHLLGGALAAAAAAAALVVILKKGPGGLPGDGLGEGPAPSVAGVDGPDLGGPDLGGADDVIPSDEFLALLPALENVDFLIDELDPLEAEALFLFETEDDLLLDLLDENG